MSKMIIIEGNSNDKNNVRAFMVKGERGYGISSIEKTATSGLVDTYTITYQDGNTDTFEVTNGYTQDLSNYYTKTQTDSEISNAIDSLGAVFNIKGSVATVSALPSTGNTVGDVYYVQNESAGYVWINDNDTLRWEQLGMTVDLTNYYTKTETDAQISASVGSINTVLATLTTISEGD